MLKFFTSLKLTLGLLLALAIISIAGTVEPAEPGHYELFYQSFWFRVLLALLAINLICCTLKTLPGKWHSTARLFAALNKRDCTVDRFPSGTQLAELKSGLETAGFQLREKDQLLLAEKGASGRWGVVLVHLSVLLIMVGAIWGEAGFVGTINTYLKQPNHQYFDWNAQRELDLGFSFRVDDFRLRYYPIQLRFDLTDVSGRQRYAQFMLHDNEAFDVPGTSFRVQLRGFDPDARLLSMEVFAGEDLLGTYLVGEKFEQFGQRRNPGFRLLNVEFRDPMLKQTEANVSVLEGGQLIEQRLIRVNEPLTYRGVSIYQIAHNRDQQGNWSVGFQLSKDPGEWLVWVGSVLLMFGFALVFLVRHRAIGIRAIDGRWSLHPLKGFRGELGRQQFQVLKQQLVELPG